MKTIHCGDDLARYGIVPLTGEPQYLLCHTAMCLPADAALTTVHGKRTLVHEQATKVDNQSKQAVPRDSKRRRELEATHGRLATWITSAGSRTGEKGKPPILNHPSGEPAVFCQTTYPAIDGVRRNRGSSKRGQENRAAM